MCYRIAFGATSGILNLSENFEEFQLRLIVTLYLVDDEKVALTDI